MAKNKKTGNPAKQSGKKPLAPAPEPSGQKTVLHVGCGAYNPNKLPAIFKGWREIRLDIDESAKPDIVANMLDMHMVEDGSVDGLFSSHNVEHLYPHQVPGALTEFNRVIKPGGMVMITLPDVQTVAAYIAEGMFEEPLYQSPAGPISPIDILYGWRKQVSEGKHYMAHKGGFTGKSLAQQLLKAGFCNVAVSREWVDLWAVGYKLAADDPRRKQSAAIRTTKFTGPQKQQLPLWYQRKLQLTQDPEAKTDELDIPPKRWKSVLK